MKYPCLFLAVLCTLVTCEAQRSNNDIIWYPVEDEDGVFISIYGEKHRDAPSSKWRSHRRARYSGMDQNPVQALPLSYDPAENQDFSFFYNINERRPGIASALSDFEGNQKKKPHKKPPGNENNLQEILNEVFDYNKYPSTSSRKPWSNNQYPQQKPTNQWGSSEPEQYTTTGDQWSGRPQTGNQWGWNSQRPTTGNQWGSNALVTGFPGQRPVGNTDRPQINQWGTSGTSAGNQWGNSRPVERPNAWLTTAENANRPNNRPGRPGGSDILVFPDDTTRNTGGTSRFTTTTPSNLVPMDPPTMSPCERSCPVTPEFNPVCGSDAMTYTNAGRLKCAQMCGKDVKLSHHGNCGRTTLVTPLVSNNRGKKSKGFWFLNN